jgi:hypothetical protein
MTRGIRVRFPSPISAKYAYEQQRDHNYRDMDTSRLMTHDDRVSPVIIPTEHMGEESEDPSLHKI